MSLFVPEAPLLLLNVSSWKLPCYVLEGRPVLADVSAALRFLHLVKTVFMVLHSRSNITEILLIVDHRPVS